MSVYVCQSEQPIQPNQPCAAWVEQVSTLEQFAITKEQAYTLCAEIALLFAVVFIFQKLRSTI